MATCLGIAGHASIGSQKPYIQTGFCQTITASTNLHILLVIAKDKIQVFEPCKKDDVASKNVMTEEPRPVT
eukprot:4542968-Ditylum_brightwellii.AAC.1